MCEDYGGIMNKLFMLVSVLLIAATSLLGVPYTSLGHVNTPDAYIMPHKMFELSYTNFFIADGKVFDGDVSGINSNDLYNFAASFRYGLANRFEIGFVACSNNIYFGNLKFKMIHETEKIPAVSLGLTNIFSGIKQFEKGDEVEEGFEFTDPIDYISNSPYIVFTKSIVIITGIAGMDYLETSFYGGLGLRRFQGMGSIVKNTSGIFGGIDFKPNKYMGLTMEYDSQNINVGINGYYKNFTLRMGVYELEDYFNIKGNNVDGVRGGSTKFAVNLKLAIDKFSDVKYAERNKVTLVTKKKTKFTPKYPEYNADENTLSEELRQIRERRKQAEQELDEIRRLLQE
jgi:hypothetical protein